MGEKNPREMISKASWSMMEVMKDAVSANLTTALRTGQLDIKSDQVQKLMTILTASVEEGYHKGFKSFDKTVQAAIAAAPEAIAREQAKKNARLPSSR